MGLGCNAAGVVGCRIIDSPRERLLAVLTNNFTPCNGRLPALFMINAIFFAGVAPGNYNMAVTAVFVIGVIMISLSMTMITTSFMSQTFLKGVPSSFALEMPSYRRPEFMKVILHSIFDRTLYVLGRAVSVAAPAGLLIFLLANVKVGDISILSFISGFLDPVAKIFGMDGTIMTAFILGIPANEIVIPLMMMIYLSQGCLFEPGSVFEIRQLFVQNGWNTVTALCVVCFILMHWPCSTTLLTIKKETGSLKLTIYAFMLPTITGLFMCFMIKTLAGLIGF